MSSVESRSTVITKDETGGTKSGIDSMDIHSRRDELESNANGMESPRGVYGSDTKQVHAEQEVVATIGREAIQVQEIEGERGGWFAYFKTKQFYIVLVLG